MYPGSSAILELSCELLPGLDLVLSNKNVGIEVKGPMHAILGIIDTAHLLTDSFTKDMREQWHLGQWRYQHMVIDQWSLLDQYLLQFRN